MDRLIKFTFTLLVVLAAVAPTNGASKGKKGLPVVDLGYERHQAISLDVRHLVCHTDDCR